MSEKSNEKPPAPTLEAYLQRLRVTPTTYNAEEEIVQLFRTKANYTKAQVAELMTLLPERNISAVKYVIMQELFTHGAKRFSVEEVVKWIDVVSQKDWNAWSVHEIVQVLDKLEINIPPEDLARWGMKGIEWTRGEKKPGSLLLIRPEVRVLPKLNEREIIYAAQNAAERGDHAATRLLGLLMYRWRSPKKRTMKEGHIICIASIIYSAFKNKEDRFFASEFMLGMVAQGLHPTTFEAVKRHYLRTVRGYLRHKKEKGFEDIEEHLQNCAKIAPVV